MTHAASYGRSTFGNVSELFRSGALIHRGVGHENGVRLSYKNVDAEGGLPFLRANHLIDFSDRLRIGAGEASDHGFGFVDLQQQRTEDIPVTIDHALTIPPQIAATLQPPVSSEAARVGNGGVLRYGSRV